VSYIIKSKILFFIIGSIFGVDFEAGAMSGLQYYHVGWLFWRHSFHNIIKVQGRETHKVSIGCVFFLEISGFSIVRSLQCVRFSSAKNRIWHWPNSSPLHTNIMIYGHMPSTVDHDSVNTLLFLRDNINTLLNANMLWWCGFYLLMNIFFPTSYITNRKGSGVIKLL
jgi:hypothetical protein